ncbi:MAG: hypothetical protein GY874_06670 [Desulfobacteraceae bacterium]|nr:hypothetical protein [Desulfobacteraceae bacterium]
MKGNIYTRQRCWICGDKLIHNDRLGVCSCKKHPKVFADKHFYVKFGRTINKRFQKYDEAARFLTGLRFKWDEGSFDERDYQASCPLGFESLAKKYIQSKELIGLRSLSNIKNYINKAIEVWGQRNVKTIKKGDIKGFLYGIEGISEKTRYNYRSTLHDFFRNFLVEEEDILSITDAPKFPDINYELGYRKITDLQTREKIIQKVHNISFHINPKIWLGIELLSSYIVLRPLDLLRLKEEDINLQHGILTFWRPTKSRNKKKVVRVRLVADHIDMIKEIKERFPGLPQIPFFRHVKGLSGCRENSTFGEKYFYKWWMKACKNLGIEGLDLYGGTRHTTTTALAMEVGEESAKKATGHDTNKAFHRYCQIQDDHTFEMAKIATKLKKATVIPFDKKDRTKE